MKTYRIQRFSSGHPLFSDAIVSFEGKEYQCVFGQCTHEDGEFMHYTLERKDTLIEEGEYLYDFYNSPANKCVVPLLTIHNGKDISQRKLEHHPANWPYELNGCCAHGKSVNIKEGCIEYSKMAFNDLIRDMNKQPGKFIYETFE